MKKISIILLLSLFLIASCQKQEQVSRPTSDIVLFPLTTNYTEPILPGVYYYRWTPVKGEGIYYYIGLNGNQYGMNCYGSKVMFTIFVSFPHPLYIEKQVISLYL